jgi:hypothetical protein
MQPSGEPNRVPAPTELIYSPRPSWAPIFFAFGGALLVCGTFAQGFIVRGWIYMIIGAVVCLAGLWSMISGAVQDFLRLPRRQRVRGAVLPAASLRSPKRG